MKRKFSDMTWFEQQKRMRNNAAGYPEDKGLKNGHCNRSGCLRPLADHPQYWMGDHETFSDARLYYCQPCAHAFDRSDTQSGAPRRCTPLVTKVGLSLSFCIKDVIEGRVAFDDIEKITTATFFTDRDMYHTGLKHGYCKTYWRADPERAHEIAMLLWDAGKIEQPRTRGEQPPSIHEGHWQ